MSITFPAERVLRWLADQSDQQISAGKVIDISGSYSPSNGNGEPAVTTTVSIGGSRGGQRAVSCHYARSVDYTL